MDQPSDKIKNFLILFIIGVFFIKYANNVGIFEAKSFNGRGYSVDFPKDWKKVKKQKGQIYPQGVEVLNIVPPGTDLKDGQPQAIISVYTKKLGTPIWIEDEFPEIVKAIVDSGFRLMDKGQIKIDEKIMHWVVYHDRKTPAIVLKFYYVSDNSIYYNIEYSADPDKFKVYRPAFEEFKDSLKFKFSMF